MRKHLDHAAPFLGYLLITAAGAALHFRLTPLVVSGVRRVIQPSGLFPGGPPGVWPLGPILYLAPALVLWALLLSYRFPLARSGGALALMGCGIALLYLAYACLLSYHMVLCGSGLL